jgi:transcriptional regulator with XRE-family HTH domain
MRAPSIVPGRRSPGRKMRMRAPAAAARIPIAGPFEQGRSRSSQISRIEQGKSLPRIGTTLRLAGALEVDVGRLLDGIHFEPRDTRSQPGG